MLVGRGEELGTVKEHRVRKYVQEWSSAYLARWGDGRLIMVLNEDEFDIRTHTLWLDYSLCRMQLQWIRLMS